MIFFRGRKYRKENVKIAGVCRITAYLITAWNSADTKGIFQFNPGIQQKTFPDYNPYTIKRCRDCDIAKGKAKLAFVPENELCAACRIVRECAAKERNTKCGAKAVRNDPKVKALQGTYIKNNSFPHDVLISRTSIRE